MIDLDEARDVWRDKYEHEANELRAAQAILMRKIQELDTAPLHVAVESKDGMRSETPTDRGMAMGQLGIAVSALAGTATTLETYVEAWDLGLKEMHSGNARKQMEADERGF